MTDEEFIVMDELYFIQGFGDLLEATEMEDQELRRVLLELLRKNWIKYHYPRDRELDFDEKEFEIKYRDYHYIATKAGLLAHNGK